MTLQHSEFAIPSNDVLLEIKDITKSFGPAQVLKGISLTIRRGEFIGLVGANGAGKSTLLKIIGGVHQQTGGVIEVLGKTVADMRNNKTIGIVHQDLGLVDSMSVLDNLMLGAKRVTAAGLFLKTLSEMREAQGALDRVGMSALGLHTEVGSLSPGEKAMLAVAKLFSRGAELIIVDETTSTLDTDEAAWLIDHLRAATEGGAAVVLVSHKLSEIRNATNRIVVLADGEVAADESAEGYRAHEEDLVKLLAGSDFTAGADRRIAPDLGQVALRLTDAHTGKTGPLNMSVRQGEVVGVTGSLGSGLHSVGLLAARVIAPHSGVVDGGAKSVALIPPQREVQGVFSEHSVAWNMTVASLRPLINLRAEGRAVGDMVERLQIKTQSVASAISTLSGGNQQKVLFARTLLQRAELFVLCEPTRGVDIQTRRQIYTLISELASEGAAVLIVTSDSEDIFAVCDRVHSITDGELQPSKHVADLLDETLLTIV